MKSKMFCHLKAVPGWR